eukprot:TRINITY_DN67117_c0_g1_i1.p1 TRINITY_DN67117_c0_g1~~TRINITY_DN67117_c0_g1_i1.p1  ORF type:complete len:436 (+),score=128.15 TRINITY_DN67117_c0_g1_i1:119-1309(+)
MASKSAASKVWYGVCIAGGGALAYYRIAMRQPLFDNYPVMDRHYNHMSQVLTRKLYFALHEQLTPSGFSLDRCIQPGVDVPGDSVTRPACGLVAGDAECYSLFALLFDKVLDREHPGARATDIQPRDLPTQQQLDLPPLSNRHVESVTLLAGRNLYGIPFLPNVSRGQRRDVVGRTAEALKALEGDYKGSFRLLADWDQKKLQELIASGVAFGKPATEEAQVAGYVRDWPDARGLFVNARGTFAVWVNHMQHVTVLARERGGDVAACFSRLARGVETLEAAYTPPRERVGEEQAPGGFVWDDRLGYLGSEPSEVGTALRCELRVRLPALGEQAEVYSNLKALGLRHCGADEEKHVYCVTSPRRLGSAESEQVREVHTAAAELIRREQAAAGAARRS